MKKHCVVWQTLLLVLALAAAHVVAPGPSFAGKAKGVRLSTRVADPRTEFLAVQVGLDGPFFNDGAFNMGANPLVADCGQGPTFTTPCRYNLMFEWPFTPGTSFTTVRVDGSDFVYGNDFFGNGRFLPLVVRPTDTDPLTNVSAAEVTFGGTGAGPLAFTVGGTGSVRVTQELKIVRGLTGDLDTARIRYVATNLDGVSHDVGLRIMIDTMLNDNDGAAFRVNGVPVTIETEYVGASVPSFFDVFFNLNVPGISARGTLRAGAATPPDRFVIAAWPNISNTIFDFAVDPNVSFTCPFVFPLALCDSAVGIYWNPVTLLPGESRVFETFYGVSGAIGGNGLLVTTPAVLDVAPDLTLGAPVGSLVWAPNPFQVDAFFTNGLAAPTNVSLTLDLSTAATQLTSSSPNPQLFSSVQPGDTVHAQWQVTAVAPGEAHYRVRAESASVLIQEIVTRVPELVVPPVENPRNPGPIPLIADGRFCRNTAAPASTAIDACTADFEGNIGGLPPFPFEWQGITPTGFKAGPTGAVPVLLNDPDLDSLVYAALDTTANFAPALDLYLMYDFLHRQVAFGPTDRPTVEFEVKNGRFQTPPGSRMVVTFQCGATPRIVIDGFDNGVRFSGRDGALLGIEGDCGFGPSPNPNGDPLFDVLFNTPHARLELEVPLTQNLGGAPRPGGGVYDPSPAFWTATAPGSGTLVLSQNTLNINIQTGGTTVTPLQPQAVPFASLRARVEIEAEEQEFEVKGTFTLGAASNGIDPLTQDVSLQVGAFTATIPAGSFRRDGRRRFKFEGVVAGVELEVKIRALGGPNFKFEAEGKRASIGSVNPVTVRLAIGDDAGSTLVRARSDD